MKRSVILGALLLLLAPEVAAAKLVQFSGVARTEDGEFLYRETHSVEVEGSIPKRAVTRYFGPDGRKIADLYSDFSKDPFAPNYRMVDPDGNVLEAARLESSRLLLRSEDRSGAKVLPKARSQRLVTGQGLDHYIRYHLQALQRGKELVVSFPIPSRVDTYLFRLKAIENGQRDVVTVQIKVDNFFLALLAPTLEADYDSKTGRLLRYRGVSNLANERGENPKVHIEYQYE